MMAEHLIGRTRRGELMNKIKFIIAVVTTLIVFLLVALSIQVSKAASELRPVNLKNDENKPTPISITETPPQPLVPSNIIRQPSGSGFSYARNPLPSAVAPVGLPPLKAVVIVGPIDPPGNDWTNAQIADMEKAAQALENHGVTVSRFYHPYANWDQIKAATAGANFLLYKGHGVYWSPMPTPTVGGFSLSDIFVSSETIRNDLHLAPGAVVMLYGCFAAGSSGNDLAPITSVEAQRRVAQYADPFIDTGAGVYFANIWDESFVAYINALFEGHIMGDVFKTFWAFDNSTFETYSYLDKSGYQLWLDPWHDTSFLSRWNQAFIGDPVSTLEDMATPSSLNLSTHSLTLLSLPEGNPMSQSIEVSNDGWWGHSFSWSATTTNNGWLSIEPMAGTLPNSTITVSVNTTNLITGTYEGQFTVSAPYVQQSPQIVQVRLVISENIYYVYLPNIQK